MKHAFLLLLILLTASPVFAQFYSTQYRSAGQNWMEIRSEHFRLIYPERYYEKALRSITILEAEYADIQQLVGGELRNFPFILNPDNDRSNGFVTTSNFRSEVELAPIRGKVLNPQSGDWLESVMPHELVHALHLSVNPPALTRAVGLFSPDMRRSVHAAAPLGILEGIAVEHESHGTIPNSGRGNYPYFTNQFNTLLGTSDEWSMGQLVQVSDFSLPFNRHYVGGYEFTNWLQNRYGDETMKEAIRFHYRWPILGFGSALRSTTGKWPANLYREFSEDMKRDEDMRLAKLTGHTDAAAEEVPFTAGCRRTNRPLWINDDTILFYGRSCNRASGFYTHNFSTQETALLYEVLITEDFYYSLSPDNSTLVYSRYHTDRFYDNLFRGDVHELDIATGKSRRISRNARLFSPERTSDLIFAMQTDAHQQQLVTVKSETGEASSAIPRREHSTVLQVAINPQNDALAAVLGRVQSVQGIWFENLTAAESLFERDPDIVFENGSVFDPHWHPTGSRLLFSSDHSGTLNVYEYDFDSERVTQITQSLFNAYEASYSPDGSSIAYVQQSGNEQILKVLPLQSAYMASLPSGVHEMTADIRDRMMRPLMNRNEPPRPDISEPERYRTDIGWLKPRLWLPLYERVQGFNKWGVTLESVDQMNRQAYSLELSHYMNRAWFDLSYDFKRFYPGFTVDLYSRPSLVSFRITQNENEFIRTLLQESRGTALKIPIRVRLESNARFTSFIVEPQYFLSQLRFLDPNNPSTAYSEFGTRHQVGLRTVLNLRLRQFFRDVQPNSGWVFFTEGRYGLNSTTIDIRTNEFSAIGNLTDRRGLRGGISTYVSPLQRFNQSLRITAQAITQTDLPVFNTASLYSDTFAENPFPGSNNVGIVNTRYTIPLVYPDEGGLLVPAYLSNIYLVLFSQTVSDLNQGGFATGARTVIGGGIRSRFRLSNLAFDVGISLGWEPANGNVVFYAGSF